MFYSIFVINWISILTHFNHIFNLSNVTQLFYQSNFQVDGENPYPYIYPVVHNGYEYISGDTVNQSGTTLTQTRLYTSSPILAGSYANTAAALAAGVKPFRINTPGQGLLNNQLKPAMSVWNLVHLLFKSYGYKIKSDFMNTPWMKTLYMYGYFSSNLTKFSYRLNSILTLPLSQVNVSVNPPTLGTTQFSLIVSQRGTGIPCFSDQEILVYFLRLISGIYYIDVAKIPPISSGTTVNLPTGTYRGIYYSQVPIVSVATLRYLPVAVGTSLTFQDTDFVDFSLVIDQNIKQIDLLSSIAKKFNLVCRYSYHI
jgi:hypothetical protein